MGIQSHEILSTLPENLQMKNLRSVNLQILLIDKVPEKAINYCHDLQQTFAFSFNITNNRRSKAGDYRFYRRFNTHHITVNNSQNQYAFLLTYIHEVAHLVTFEKYGRNIRPHGTEWKSTFRNLMLPLLNSDIFPDDILKVLARHLKNPRASTHSDHRLVEIMRKYSLQSESGNQTILRDLKPGLKFEFNDRIFEKLETRRTRIVCLEQRSGNKYLIPGIALVNMI